MVREPSAPDGWAAPDQGANLPPGPPGQHQDRWPGDPRPEARRVPCAGSVQALARRTNTRPGRISSRPATLTAAERSWCTGK